MPNYSDEGNYTSTMHTHMRTSSYCDKVPTSLQNSRFSSLLAAGGVQRRGTSATQRQKFHTDDHGFARLMSHWVIVLRLYLAVACVNAYNGLLLEGENHYQWVCVCCVLPILCFLMSPLCKKCPNNNNNTRICIAPFPWAQCRFTIIVILKK